MLDRTLKDAPAVSGNYLKTKIHSDARGFGQHRGRGANLTLLSGISAFVPAVSLLYKVVHI